MADRPTTTDTAGGAQYLASTINANFAIIEEAIEDCLGRGGTGESPNSMEGVLDMDLNQIQNLPTPTLDKHAANKAYVDGKVSSLLAVDQTDVTTSKSSGSAVDWDAVNNNSITTTFETYTELQSIDAFIDGDSVVVLGRTSAGDGGGGIFYWSSADLSTEVSSDPYSGIYLAPTSDTTGESGAWIRIRDEKEFNVAWFGAFGDGLTEYTANINAALALANVDPTYITAKLVFNGGIYIIQPGVMSTIKCSVYGPDAIFIGNDSTDQHIFKLNYITVYPVAQPIWGSSSSYVTQYAAPTFKVRSIIGSYDDDKKNTGIYCVQIEGATIDVHEIRGCSAGFICDIATNGLHCGMNDIHIKYLFSCGTGFYFKDGADDQMFFEANRITGEYWYDFPTAGIYSYSVGSQRNVNNVFDILAFSPGADNLTSVGIWLGTTSGYNTFRINSWDSGAAGTSYLIGDNGYNNTFEIPSYDPDTMDTNSTTNINVTSVGAQYDVTATRALDTVYQNTSGKGYTVYVTGVSSTSGGGIAAYVGLDSDPTVNLISNSALDGSETYCISFHVKHGYYYKVTQFYLTSTLASWVEVVE